MVKLYGKEFTKRELMKRVGDISQIAGAKLYELKAGKAKGVEAVDFKTGEGLTFTVLPGRCMDIAWAGYKEFALSYISPTGVVAPEYFCENGLKGFLDNFFAGLLTTCGLTHFGVPCSDAGEELGLHGVIGNIPAEDLAVYNEWEDNEFVMKVRGKMRQSSFLGENLVLTREITTKLGDKCLRVRDKIENAGFKEQPFMLLYHIQFGYPIVSEDTRLVSPEVSLLPRTEEAKKGVGSYNRFQSPTSGYVEQCFYHDHKANSEGNTYAGLFNPALSSNGIGAYVKYNKNKLPYFVEWKQMSEQEYAVGLEPGTWYAEGRAEARKRGELQFIQPGEIKEFDLEIGVVEGHDELSAISK